MARSPFAQRDENLGYAQSLGEQSTAIRAVDVVDCGKPPGCLPISHGIESLENAARIAVPLQLQTSIALEDQEIGTLGTQLLHLIKDENGLAWASDVESRYRSVRRIARCNSAFPSCAGGLACRNSGLVRQPGSQIGAALPVGASSRADAEASVSGATSKAAAASNGRLLSIRHQPRESATCGASDQALAGLSPTSETEELDTSCHMSASIFPASSGYICGSKTGVFERLCSK